MQTQLASVRRHARRLIIELAELRVRGEPRLYHCIIREISSGGARLRVPLDFPKYGEFDLVSKAVGIDGPVRIIWREEHTIGVAFDRRVGPPRLGWNSDFETSADINSRPPTRISGRMPIRG